MCSRMPIQRTQGSTVIGRVFLGLGLDVRCLSGGAKNHDNFLCFFFYICSFVYPATALSLTLKPIEYTLFHMRLTSCRVMASALIQHDWLVSYDIVHEIDGHQQCFTAWVPEARQSQNRGELCALLFSHRPAGSGQR